MILPMNTPKFLALIGLLAVLGSIGAAAFFFGGFFSVAANNSDPNIVNLALVHVRKASIARHAIDQPPGSLDDPAMVKEGARAYFHRGCVDCHGGPGVEPADFAAGLNPQPNLKRVITALSPQEVFWVIKNGIKMTGMPGFGSAAFLKHLPNVSDEDFKAWTSGSPVVTVPPMK